MADEKQSPDEDEYQFADIDSTNVFGTHEEDVMGGAGEPNPMIRNVIIAISVIAVIFTIYKLMGLYFTPKSKTTSNAKTTVTKVAPTPKQPTITKMTPVKPMEPTTPLVTQPSTESLDKMKNEIQVLVRQQNMDNKTELDRLNSSVATMRTELIDINNTLAQLKNSLAELDSKMADLKKPAPKKAVSRRPKRVYRGIPKARSTHYVIQAMIPGRAWIKSANGSTLTISEGSRVPGYGVVREIDAQKGIVTTHTGATIKYPPEER